MVFVGPRAESNRSRASRTPTSRSTASDAALTPCPANLPGAEHESLRSQYAGKPATGRVGLFFVAIRVMVGRTDDLHVFQHGDLGSAVANRAANNAWRWNQYSFGFACGSFQYGRVVTYFSFASKRSFRNSFSVSCIFARILLAVVGPTP